MRPKDPDLQGSGLQSELRLADSVLARLDPGFFGRALADAFGGLMQRREQPRHVTQVRRSEHICSLIALREKQLPLQV